MCFLMFTDGPTGVGDVSLFSAFLAGIEMVLILYTVVWST